MEDRSPLDTLEMRWFLPGSLKEYPQLSDCFMNSRPVPCRSEPEAPRWQKRMNEAPDVYLPLPGHDDLGIKLREGQVQIKGRLSRYGTCQLAERHAGMLERWVKWSYSDLPAAFVSLFADDAHLQLPRIAVHKTRALRRFQLSPFDGSWIETPVDANVDHGLNLELTELQVTGQSWCSLAAEAFPLTENLPAGVTRLLDAFLGHLDGLTLTAAQSGGYPAWLGQLAQSEQ